MIRTGRLFNFSAPRGSPFPGAIFTGEGGGGLVGGGVGGGGAFIR